MVYMKTIRSILFLLIILLFSISKAEIYVAESIKKINNTILKLLSKRDPEKNASNNAFRRVHNKTIR